ncbi:flocculation protein FLO11-like [Trichoplusia ni]|uniref:Flocculation protein FLO11-like n=1 Tax=Trichoplusia ni TaxID=7111 RepID=A0A7E5VKZ4_TRINI|nr:flocculation protein FLO11-like [Trichoplusia ni]
MQQNSPTAMQAVQMKLKINKPIPINNLKLDADKICWIEGGQKASLDMNQNATATSEIKIQTSQSSTLPVTSTVTSVNNTESKWCNIIIEPKLNKMKLMSISRACDENPPETCNIPVQPKVEEASTILPSDLFESDEEEIQTKSDPETSFNSIYKNEVTDQCYITIEPKFDQIPSTSSAYIDDFDETTTEPMPSTSDSAYYMDEPSTSINDIQPKHDIVQTALDSISFIGDEEISQSTGITDIDPKIEPILSSSTSADCIEAFETSNIAESNSEQEPSTSFVFTDDEIEKSIADIMPSLEIIPSNISASTDDVDMPETSSTNIQTNVIPSTTSSNDESVPESSNTQPPIEPGISISDTESNDSAVAARHNMNCQQKSEQMTSNSDEICS